ncbi:hypothetical protein LOD99_4862 [Oopsacas minuta]|uniref:Uncharacterized protein n=1 Tax=Oopsacas minuta TaxID=111878 RepID=A0AAV7JT72_9METZ|nr:hypothetical protein LOD99_4862 [Oopsacas minuta]
MFRRFNRRRQQNGTSSYSNQYLQEISPNATELEIELVSEISALNAAEHIVVEKIEPFLCIAPCFKKTRYVHGILLDNDPMNEMFLKVALYERKGKRENCSIIDILKFSSNYNLYRVMYDERSNLKAPDDVINIAAYIANNPSHLEYHKFSNSEDFAVFCKIEWARTTRIETSYLGGREDQGFFWDEDDDPLLEPDRSPLLMQNEL